MINNYIHTILMVTWIIGIIAILFLSIVDFRKYKKLGKCYGVNQKRISKYKVNAIIFTLLAIISLEPLINQDYIYSLYYSLGISIFALRTIFISYKSPKIYENGITLDNTIISWNEVNSFTWISVENENLLELCLIANYTQIRAKFTNKKIEVRIKKEEKDKIKNLLLLKGIDYI